MDPAVLQAFLASVRKANFIDYLDPMGETAQQALDRRIKWASRNRRDPSHGDEAEFLLQYQDGLRQVVLDELLNDDEGWVEDTDAGTGWGQPTPYGSSRREDKVTSLDVDDLEADPTSTEEPHEGAAIMRMEDVSVPPAKTRTETPDELPEDLVRDIWNKNAPEGSPSATEEWPEQDTDPNLSADPEPEVAPITDLHVEVPAVRRSAVGFSAEQRDEGDSSWAHGWNDTPAPAERAEEPPPPSQTSWVTHDEDEENEPEPTPLPAPRTAPALIATPPNLDVPKPKTALSIRASQNRPKTAASPAGGRGRIIGLLILILLVAGGGGAGWWFLAGPGATPTTPTDAEPVPVPEAPAPAPEPAPEPDVVPEPEPVEGDGDDDDAAVAAAPEPTPEPAPQVRPAPRPAPAPAPAPVAAPAPAPAPAPVAAPAPEPEPEPDAPEAPPMLTGTWAGIAANRNFELKIESQIARSFSGQAQLMNDAGEYESFSILGKVEVGGAFSFSQKGGGAQFKGQAKGVRLSGTVTLADGTAGKFSLIGS